MARNLGMVTAYAYAVAGGYTGTEAEFEELLGNIADDLSQIENLSVTVTTLTPGSSATASYSNGVLSLGIPAGDKGDTGETPNLSIGTVTTLSAGADATATITGTAENPVLNLGLPKGADGSLASGVLASTYSTSKTYAVGDYVYYSGNLYRCTTAITTAEAWTSAHWTQVALADDVSDLKSDFSTFSGYTNYMLNTGAYYATNGSTVNIESPSSNSGWKSVVVPCSAGDVFYVTGHSGSSPRLWCFVDASNSTTAATSLAVAIGSAQGDNLAITAPANTTHLVCNMNTSYDAKLTQGLSLADTVAKIDADIAKVDSVANGVFVTNCPELACIIDADIYVRGYEKIAINYFWYNSPSHTSYEFYVNFRGYRNNEWETLDGAFYRSAKPSNRPDVERISVGGVADLLINWNLIGSTFTSAYNDTNRPVFKGRCFSYAQTPSYEERDGIKNIVIVDANGSGDFTTLTAAYASIQDSSFDNQYEVIVLDGTYQEQYLTPPPYTHTHGIKAENTIITSVGLPYSDDINDWMSVFQMENTCKLSNLTVISGTKYCIHEDSFRLSNKIIKCENLYLYQTKAHNNAIVGNGSQFGGTKYIFNNCTFVNGSFTTHTNTRVQTGSNQHTVLNGCKFVDAVVTLASVGTTLDSNKGIYVFEINNCAFNPIANTVVMRFGEPITGLSAPNFPWTLCGANNKGINISWDNTSDTRFADSWDSVNLDEKTYVKASETIAKGDYVTSDGHVTTSSNAYGIALDSASSNDYIPIWLSAN